MLEPSGMVNRRRFMTRGWPVALALAIAVGGCSDDAGGNGAEPAGPSIQQETPGIDDAPVASDAAPLFADNTVQAMNDFMGSQTGAAISSSPGFLSAALSPAAGGLLIRTTDPGAVDSLVAGAAVDFEIVVERSDYSRVELLELRSGLRSALGDDDVALWVSHVDWEQAHVVVEISSTASEADVDRLAQEVARYSGDPTGREALEPLFVALLDHPINTTPD